MTNRELREEYLRYLDGSERAYGTELIKIVLCNAFGEKAAGVASALSARFPSAVSVLEADYNELLAVDGVTPAIAAYLKCVGMLIKQTRPEELRLKGGSAFENLVRKRLGEAENEVMEFYLVDKDKWVTDIKTFSSGRFNRAEISAMDILGYFAGDGVCAMCFAHNHVGCGAEPSPEDDATTEKLKRACEAFGIEFIDHCIVGQGGSVYSYAAHKRIV